MIKEITIFGKKYIWNVERFIWNMLLSLLLIGVVVGMYYMLKLESIELIEKYNL